MLSYVLSIRVCGTPSRLDGLDLKKTKAEWDKAAVALANVNSKTINAIFCGVSTDEFHRISHVLTS